jgi:hypothetical protein
MAQVLLKMKEVRDPSGGTSRTVAPPGHARQRGDNRDQSESAMLDQADWYGPLQAEEGLALFEILELNTALSHTSASYPLTR